LSVFTPEKEFLLHAVSCVVTGSNPMTVSNNAIVVQIYNIKSSLVSRRIGS
jgi:hypothetical protein